MSGRRAKQRRRLTQMGEVQSPRMARRLAAIAKRRSRPRDIPPCWTSRLPSGETNRERERTRRLRQAAALPIPS